MKEVGNRFRSCNIYIIGILVGLNRAEQLEAKRIRKRREKKEQENFPEISNDLSFQLEGLSYIVNTNEKNLQLNKYWYNF